MRRVIDHLRFELSWTEKLVLIAVAWASTRLPLYVFGSAHTWRVIFDAGHDVVLYHHWYLRYLSHGVYPAASSWQYPPAAAVVFWLPAQLPGGYHTDFALLAVCADLLVLVMLAWRGRHGGSLAGACYWTAGVPLAGPLLAMRFDVYAVAFSVAALCVARTWIGRGALAGAGAAVKVWPVAVAAGLPPGQWRRGAGMLAATAAVITGSLALFLHGALGFARHQGERGVEVESVAASPFMLARHLGWHAVIKLQNGSFQLIGTHVTLAMYASVLGLVLSAAAVAVWRLLIERGRLHWQPEFLADAPLAATLLLVTTSRVLSPQYLLWVTGLAACCLAAGRSTQRPAAAAILGIDALTTVVYPLGFGPLLAGSDLITAVLVTRNALLVAVTAWSCWRLVRAGTALAIQGVPANVLPPRRPGWEETSINSISHNTESLP